MERAKVRFVKKAILTNIDSNLRAINRNCTETSKKWGMSVVTYKELEQIVNGYKAINLENPFSGHYNSSLDGLLKAAEGFTKENKVEFIPTSEIKEGCEAVKENVEKFVNEMLK